jgi:F0F1-type ATP synthase assembly protein I
MAGKAAGKKKQLVLIVVLGLLSLASYVAILANQTLITDTFTRGGYYLFFPVMTAFFFSFLHGAFAHNVLSALGIEASKRKASK